MVEKTMLKEIISQEFIRTKNGYTLWVGSNNKVYLSKRDGAYKLVIYKGKSQRDAFKYLLNYLENHKGWLGHMIKTKVKVRGYKREKTTTTKGKVGYGVLYVPKIKGSLYSPFLMKPYLSKVRWTKARARKEAEFGLKGVHQKSGLKMGKIYKYKIVKL